MNLGEFSGNRLRYLSSCVYLSQHMPHRPPHLPIYLLEDMEKITWEKYENTRGREIKELKHLLDVKSVLFCTHLAPKKGLVGYASLDAQSCT